MKKYPKITSKVKPRKKKETSKKAESIEETEEKQTGNKTKQENKTEEQVKTHEREEKLEKENKTKTELEEKIKEENRTKQENLEKALRTDNKLINKKQLYTYILEPVEEKDQYLTYKGLKEMIEKQWLDEYISDIRENKHLHDMEEQELLDDYTVREVMEIIIDYKSTQEVLEKLEQIIYGYLEERAKEREIELNKTKSEYYVKSLTVPPTYGVILNKNKEQTEKFFRKQQEEGKDFKKGEDSKIIQILEEMGYRTNTWYLYEEFVVDFVINAIYPLTIGEIKEKIEEKIPELEKQQVELIG